MTDKRMGRVPGSETHRLSEGCSLSESTLSLNPPPPRPPPHPLLGSYPALSNYSPVPGLFVPWLIPFLALNFLSSLPHPVMACLSRAQLMSTLLSSPSDHPHIPAAFLLTQNAVLLLPLLIHQVPVLGIRLGFPQNHYNSP